MTGSRKRDNAEPLDLDAQALEGLLMVLSIEGGDAEVQHIAADQFLRAWLKTHGYPKLAKLLEELSTDWWYA